MRVYGLKSSAKSFGWLLGLLFFGLTILYPPVPFSVLAAASPLASALSGLRYNFSYTLTTGGIVWQIISYLHWQSFASIPWMSRTLVTEFAPYCFVPVTLPLCALVLWPRLVDYAARPTIIRGVLTVLLTLISSLVLIFLLDWVGGRVLLHILSISLMGNIEVRDLISVIWMTAIIQSVLFALPFLVIGGLLAWLQGYREDRLRSARRNASVTRQE